MNANTYTRKMITVIAAAALCVALTTTAAPAADYAALKDVQGVKAVFDVSLADPASANVVFGAVQNVYQDQSVRSLAQPPHVAVVFHGPAVKLISTDHAGFSEDEKKSLEQFAGMISQMKKDGVQLEVCDYALKVLKVDPATVLPEVDHVGNGFISVVGYQSQGYSVVTIK